MSSLSTIECRPAGRRAAALAALLLAGAVAACQPVRPDQLPPLRDRNYLCQMPALGDTHEDEVACEDNKRPLMER